MLCQDDRPKLEKIEENHDFDQQINQVQLLESTSGEPTSEEGLREKVSAPTSDVSVVEVEFSGKGTTTVPCSIESSDVDVEFSLKLICKASNNNDSPKVFSRSFRSTSLSVTSMKVEETSSETMNESATSRFPLENAPINQEPCNYCAKYGSIRKRPLCSVSKCSELLFTKCELKKHATVKDCWITARGLVYDVTPYINKHPGGKICLLDRARRAADAYDDYKFHSSRGHKVWETLKIGTLIPCEGLIHSQPAVEQQCIIC